MAGAPRQDPRKPAGPAFIDDVLDILLQLYVLYGFSTAGYSLEPTRRHWQRLLTAAGGDEAAAIKLTKYKLAAFAGIWLEQETLPPRPFGPEIVDNPRVLLSGRAWMWARLVLKGRTEHHPLGFIASCLYSKKGMPRPSKTVVKAAEVKTAATLTEARKERQTIPLVSRHDIWAELEDEETDPHPEDGSVTRTVITREINRTIDELWEGVRPYGLEDRMKPMFPSTSANYNHSRSELGAVGELLSHPELFKGLRSRDGPLRVRRVFSEESRHGDSTEAFEVDSTDLEVACGVLYERALKEALTNEVPIVQPVGLPEALKVRVISKGPPLTYFVLKALQQYMWSALEKHPVLALTGTPVSEELLTAFLGRLRAGEKWVSVDYEAATDNLESWVSDVAVDRIALRAGLREEEKKLFKRALTGHIFEMPEGDDKFKRQKVGQLMGSIVSFPVLCVINVALCRYSLEVSRRMRLRLNECALVVNGDDAALPLTSRGFRVWAAVTSFAGLLPSVGKVYQSASVVNVNSTFFRYHPDVGDEQAAVTGRWSLVHYVNLGLLLGQKRSGLGSQVYNPDTGRTIGARSRELWRLTPSCLRQAVAAKFIQLNLETLKSVDLPWGVPEHLGGLGIAGAFVNEGDLRIARSIVADGIVVPPIRTQTAWQVRRLAEQQLPQGNPRKLTDIEAERYEHWLGLLGVNLLFTTAAEPGSDPADDGPYMGIRLWETIFKVVDDSARFKAQLRPRTALWRRRMKKGNFAPVNLITHQTVDGEEVRDSVTFDYDNPDPESGFPAWMRTKHLPIEGLAVSQLVSLRQPTRGIIQQWSGRLPGIVAPHVEEVEHAPLASDAEGELVHLLRAALVFDPAAEGMGLTP